MWVRGAVAAESAAPEQPAAEQDAQARASLVLCELALAHVCMTRSRQLAVDKLCASMRCAAAWPDCRIYGAVPHAPRPCLAHCAIAHAALANVDCCRVNKNAWMSTALRCVHGVQAEGAGKAQRAFVIKDEGQPRCALCGEPFTEEWDEDLQEWIYVDAVRLPAEIAGLPGIGLPAGSIVKAGLLDSDALKLLGDYTKRREGEAGRGVKRKGEWGGKQEGGPPAARIKTEAGAQPGAPPGT
jgi:hypothetical protein